MTEERQETHVNGKEFGLPNGRKVFLARGLPEDDGLNLIMFTRPRDESITDEMIAQQREEFVRVEDGKIVTRMLLGDDSLEALVRLVLDTNAKVDFKISGNSNGN